MRPRCVRSAFVVGVGERAWEEEEEEVEMATVKEKLKTVFFFQRLDVRSF